MPESSSRDSAPGAPRWSQDGEHRRAPDRERLERRIAELGPWFHNMNLGGVWTAPNHFLGDYPRFKFDRFAHALPDLRGKSVLDIGCNAGFYALEMKRRGAARVVGIDRDANYLAQARFAAEVLGQELELHQLDAYQVGELGEKFDVVIFMGVLYHLRYPLLALDLLYEHVVGDLLVFQTMLRGSDELAPVEEDYEWDEHDSPRFEQPGYPKMYFVERCYADDPTNWWIANPACAAAMLRSAGFRIEDRPEREVFVCRRGPRPRLESPSKRRRATGRRPHRATGGHTPTRRRP